MGFTCRGIFRLAAQSPDTLITTGFREKQINHDPSQNGSEPKSIWRSRYAIGLLVLGAVAAFFLLNEHRAHFFGALPYLLLLA